MRWRPLMAIRCGKAAWICALALVPVLTGPGLAQPYGWGPGGAYAPPYPGYYQGRHPRAGYPVIQYDSAGQAIPPGELGWHPGPPSSAPANPCTLGLRQQNRC